MPESGPDSKAHSPNLLSACAATLGKVFTRSRDKAEKDEKTDEERRPSRIRLSHSTRTLRRRPEKAEMGDSEKSAPVDLKQIQSRVLALEDHSQQYRDLQKRREFLVQQETVHSWDKAARKSATTIEKRAARIVHKIREFERAAPGGPFGNIASENVPHGETRDMGGQFLTNKDRIDNHSKLFDIAKKMPKGGLLHLHLNAQLLPNEVLNYADKHNKVPDTLYVASNRHLLKEEDFRECEIQVAVLDFEKEFDPEPDLFTQNFTCFQGTKPDTKDRMQWMRWRSFREKFKGTRFAEERRLQYRRENPRTKDEYDHIMWVKEKLILSPEEVYGYHQTVNGIWARFNQSTRAFKGFLNFKSAFEWYIGAAIDEMIADGIMYAELRPMWLDKSIPGEDGPLGHNAQIQIVRQAVASRKNDFKFGFKIIYCTPRSIKTGLMEKEITDCINVHINNPDIMCGFDLVGAEDRANHVGFYLKQLLTLQEISAEKKVNIPFMFHAGETLIDRGGSFNTANSNLYDSVALKAKRIGHGFALPKHPELMRQFAQQKICIELCPISNELLHLCRNVKEHPFPQLLEAGIPCTLNSDNPSLFSSSLSHEFYQVMVGWPRMTLHGWKQLAIWSIEYSCLSMDKQEEALAEFSKRWEIYCHWIVQAYEKNVYQLKSVGEELLDIKDVKITSSTEPDDDRNDGLEGPGRVPEEYAALAQDISRPEQMPYELTSASY